MIIHLHEDVPNNTREELHDFLITTTGTDQYCGQMFEKDITFEIPGGDAVVKFAKFIYGRFDIVPYPKQKKVIAYPWGTKKCKA